MPAAVRRGGVPLAISFECSNCGKRLKTDDKFAGRSVPCPACKEIVAIPLSNEDADAKAYDVLSSAIEDPKPPIAPNLNSGRNFDQDEDNPPVRRTAHRSPSIAEINRPKQSMDLPPLTAHVTPIWLRHLHWLLALALIPLIVSFLHKSSNE